MTEGVGVLVLRVLAVVMILAALTSFNIWFWPHVWNR